MRGQINVEYNEAMYFHRLLTMMVELKIFNVHHAANLYAIKEELLDV